MSKIKDYIKKLDLSAKDIAIIILSIIIVLLSIGVGVYYHKYHEANGQIVIWNDSAYIYKNKYNEEYAAKNTYILKANELEKYNSELYAEYKSLKDNPVVITKTNVITKIDTVKTIISSINNDSNKIQWNWEATEEQYYKISGVSGISKTFNDPYTIINTATINTALTLDVVDDGNQLAVIAKTDNPYVTLSNMQSVVIDPTNSPTIKKMIKQKRWGFGPTISAGLIFGVDFKGQPIIGGGGLIGFSVHYDLIQW